MINTEYLAISAILIVGIIVGYKIKEALYNLREYYSKRI